MMLTSILDVWSHPAQRHAMLVHFPVVLTFVCLGLILPFAFLRGKSGVLRIMLILLLTVGAILSYLASNAGSLAIHHLTLPLTDAAQQTLETHETMGRWTWLFFAMAAGVTAMTGLSLRLVRYPATILAVLLMMILTGWIIKVGHDGGSLVYQHGVGVPASTNNTAPAP